MWHISSAVFFVFSLGFSFFSSLWCNWKKYDSPIQSTRPLQVDSFAEPDDLKVFSSSKKKTFHKKLTFVSGFVSDRSKIYSILFSLSVCCSRLQDWMGHLTGTISWFIWSYIISSKMDGAPHQWDFLLWNSFLMSCISFIMQSTALYPLGIIIISIKNNNHPHHHHHYKNAWIIIIML